MDHFLLHQGLEQHRVVLSFHGTVTPNVSLGVLDAIERYMNARKETTSVSRKVYNVLVECLHNLFHHPTPRPVSTSGMQLPERSSVLMVRLTDSGYEVSTGNYVRIEKAQWLHSRLSEINSCPPEKLKELYRNVLANDERTERGGSGLGFIDIVRKSGGPVEHAIHQVDEHCSFFSFKACIPLRETSNTIA